MNSSIYSAEIAIFKKMQCCWAGCFSVVGWERSQVDCMWTCL